MQKHKKKSKHHYIPVFYSKNFTSLGVRDDLLFVYDVIERKGFLNSPLKVGFKNHDNRFTTKGGVYEDDLVEEMYGRIESDAARVIEKILNKEVSLPIRRKNSFVFLSPPKWFVFRSFAS